MADKTVVISVPPGKSLKIVKWKIRKDVFVSIGQIILLYNDDSDNVSELRKFKATEAGTVKSLAAMEGEIVQPGEKLLELEECTHPTVMKDMCAECGADLRSDTTLLPNSTASVPMVHSVPELKVSEEEAQRLGREDSERLLKDRKLVLLVDLDQTLVHTTNDNIPANIKDVYHFQLRGWGRWYHSRLRPGTTSFLLAVAPLFELHICTFGARAYAHKVARLLDPRAHLFSQRILSRDECFDIQSKTPNLRALFPCGDNLVCIIDDREDVWNRAPNLIQVRPYHFFEHTGDIHAPPGLDKTDSDREGQGMHIDLTIEDLNDKDATKFPTVKNGAKPTEDLPLLESTNSETVPVNTTDDEKSNDTTDTTLSEVPVEPVESNSVTVSNTVAVPLLPDATAVPLVTDTAAVPLITDTAAASDVIMVPDVELSDTLKLTDVNRLSESTEFSDTNKMPRDIKSDEQITPQDNVVDSEMNFEDIDPEKVLEEEIEEITSLNPDDAIVPDATDLSSELTLELEAEINDTENADKSKDPDENLNENDVQNPAVPTKWKTTADGMIEVEDKDDYLLYLEDILKRIHKFFYEVYDAMEAGSVPDLKTIIPQVKSQVLAGTSLVFSGLVPTYQKLEHSRAYLVARSLGADVTQDLTPETTHLVAVRPGTAKVHACGRVSGRPAPFLVTAGWLWACAERWARCEERLFPLRGAGRGPASRRPPAHCASPPRPEVGGAPRKRTPSGRFMDTINPLLSFSSDDIADMDKEVEDIINESEESDGGEEEVRKAEEAAENELRGGEEDGEDSQERELKKVLRGEVPSDTDSEESLSGGDHPHGWVPPRKRRLPRSPGDKEEGRCPSPDEESPSKRFRRGEDLPSDGPDASDSDTCGSQDPPDDTDDGRWNLMGAALEREFLGLDD